LKIAIKHFQILGWYVWFRMICENCGARIGKKERYCPNCGREVFNSSEKPLQQKYLRGGYSSEEESFQEPYQDWDDYDKDPYEAYHENDEIFGGYKVLDNSKDKNKDHNQLDHQGADFKEYYLSEDHADDHPDTNQSNLYSSPTKQTPGRGKGYKQGYESDNKYDSGEMGYNKEYDKGYGNKKPYKRKHEGGKGYDNRHKKNKGYKSNSNKNYYKRGNKVKRGYDLDAYYGSQEKKSSMTGTIVLFLVMALLMGLVLGFIFFSTTLKNII